jgi:hypothetical protein
MLFTKAPLLTLHSKRVSYTHETSLTETYSTAHKGKHLSDKFPTENSQKQGYASTPLLRKVQEDQVGLKMDETISFWFTQVMLIYWK